MALNPPLNQNGTPFRLQSEYILVERKGMEAEVKVKGMSKLSGKGIIYVTTARMIFVNKNYQKESFKAIDIPIANIIKPEFKQPIFGANYLKMDVAPLHNLLPNQAEVKFWFMNGGCDRFLKIFQYVSEEVYKQIKSGRNNNVLQQNWQNGYFNKNQGFQDPSDPTVIFMNQPELFNPNSDFIGNNIYVDPNVKYPGLNDYAPQINNNQQNQTNNNQNNYDYPSIDDYSQGKNQNQTQNQGQFKPGLQPNQQQGQFPPGFQPNQQQGQFPPGFQPNQNQGQFPPGFQPNQNQGQLPPGFQPNQNQGQFPPGFQPNQNQGFPPGFQPNQNQGQFPPGFQPNQNQGFPPGFQPNQNQGQFPPGFQPNQNQGQLPPGFQPNQNQGQLPPGFQPNQYQDQRMNNNYPNVNNPQQIMHDQQNQDQAKYFGFFGPKLEKGNNQLNFQQLNKIRKNNFQKLLITSLILTTFSSIMTHFTTIITFVSS